MRIRRFLLPLLFLLTSMFCQSAVAQRHWRTDILGSGFEALTIVQPHDEKPRVPVTTIIRHLADSLTGISAECAVLYVHGFNDYFFQKEMAQRFAARGYDFYAVDLRDYGRSIVKGRQRYDTRSLDSYFPDIDSALRVISEAGIKEVVLMGHSTGGLISAYFENSCHPAIIKALILNSPFLDWNQGWKETIIPAVSLLGRVFPNLKISQSDSTAYFESLYRGAHGEWDLDPKLKLAQSPDVTAGWIRAISLAQNSLRGGRSHIAVPILVLYSSNSVYGDKWTPAFQRGDAVLDVADIKKYGSQLGPDVTLAKVSGGLHDLMLSASEIREPLYRYIFSWLRRHQLNP